MTKEEQVARIRGALERLLTQHEKVSKLNSKEAQMIAGRSLGFIAEVIEHEFLTLTDILYKDEKEQSSGVDAELRAAYIAGSNSAFNSLQGL